MIFVDSTVALSLIGEDERRTDDARLLLERVITAGDRLATDAVVLQEILQICTDNGCPEAVEPAIELLIGITDEVLAVDEIDAIRAKEMLYGPERLSTGCCVHLAVMERCGVARIMSFDATYDRYSGVSRLTP